MDFGEDVLREKRPQEPVAMNPRRLKITMDTVKEHGFTEHCRQCDHIKAFGEAKGGLPHSEACRVRIVEAMRATTRGAARVQDAEARLDRALIERVREADTAAVPPPPAAEADNTAAVPQPPAADEPAAAAEPAAAPSGVQESADELISDDGMEADYVASTKARWAVPTIPARIRKGGY